jgi:S1-C subfamily serine protease
MDMIRAAACCLLCSIPSMAHAQEQTAAQLLKNIQPSLVEIRAVDSKTVEGPNGQKAVATYHSQGLGVIIDSYGTIATNTHIISNAGHIFVGLSDGTILEAKRVYSSEADFSFIKIDPPYPLQAVTWSDSSLARAGTPVLGLSNTDDEHQQIQGGEITGLMDGMSTDSVELFELNLNLSHGDSGGPLLDNQGHLLGLIMAKRTDQDNKTYAIASNKIQQEYEQYKQNPSHVL